MSSHRFSFLCAIFSLRMPPFITRHISPDAVGFLSGPARIAIDKCLASIKAGRYISWRFRLPVSFVLLSGPGQVFWMRVYGFVILVSGKYR